MHNLSRSFSAPASTSSSLIDQLLDYVQQQKAPPESAGYAQSSSAAKRTHSQLQPPTRSTKRFELTTEEWMDCLLRFRESCSNITTEQDSESHECSSGCPFFCYKTHLYVCKLSGNLHECTSESCDRLIETRLEKVCELTCTSYDCDIPMDSGFGNDESEMNYRANKKKVKQNARTLTQQIRDMELKNKLKEKKETKNNNENLTAEERKEVRTNFGYQRKELLVDRHTKEMDALVVIKKALPSLSNPLETASLVVDLWIRVQHNLVKDSSEKSEYTFFYHTIAVLFCIKDGGYVLQGKEIVPINQHIKKSLPSKKQLKTQKTFAQFRCSRATTAGRILLNHLKD